MRKRQTIAVAFLALCQCLCLCQGCGTGDDPPRGHALVIGVGRDFYDGPDSRAFLHGSTHTWEALTYLDGRLSPTPWLAESWSTPDGGRTWIFRLRRGVRFHDGSPLTASDAAFCLRRIQRTARYDPSGSLRDLEEVRAQGDDLLVCRLARPSPIFPALVAYYGSPVIKPGQVDARGRIRRLVGTGPFKVERVIPGQEIRLEAFPDYWGPKPAYGRVVFRTLTDAQTRVMALMAGDLDAVADVGSILPEQEPELASLPGVRLKRVEVATTHYLLFNCRRPPFSDLAARRLAVGTCQRARLVESLAGGVATPARDPYSRLAEPWAGGLLRPPADGGEAAAPGRPLIILLHGGTVQRWPYLDMAQALQGRLRALGLPARIEVAEAGTYYEALRRGDFDLCLQPNTLMTGDPDFFYSYYLASGGPANQGWRCPEADRLIAEARGEMDRPRRQALYLRLEELVRDHLPLWPLFHELALYAHRDRVADFRMDYFFRPGLIRAHPAAAKGSTN